MSRPRTVAVVGLGLIGGSLARDLAAEGVRVLGYDRDGATVRDAREAGIVHMALGPELQGAEQADAVALAVPVSAVPRVLHSAAPRLREVGLIMDLGSVQRGSGEAALPLGLAMRFVGTHPLAGDHRSGWAASRRGLFEGARVFLCPTRGTAAGTVEAARAIWEGVGARPELLDPEVHDRRLAWTSHLPQLTSTALALALDEAGMSRGELGAGGRDATRLAGSSPEMWTDIALANADVLGEGVEAVIARLSRFAAALREGDAAQLHDLFSAGRGWSER